MLHINGGETHTVSRVSRSHIHFLSILLVFHVPGEKKLAKRTDPNVETLFDRRTLSKDRRAMVRVTKLRDAMVISTKRY
jgi:hypothetical protein